MAHRESYFEILGDYRRGEIRPLLHSFAQSSRIAAAESRITATRLSEIPYAWQELVGASRRGSTLARLLDFLPAKPILSTEDAEALLDAPRSSVYRSINRLHEVGVLRPLTNRKRDQIWGAGAILDELDDLSARIARAST